MDDIKAILKDNLIGTVATLNGDGSPWATPVHIFADDEALYWFSKDTHQHSLNIVLDPRVSVALWSRDGGTKGACVSGSAEKLDTEATLKAQDIVIATVGKVPPVFENTSAYRVKIGQSDTSRTSENRWYFYS